MTSKNIFMNPLPKNHQLLTSEILFYRKNFYLKNPKLMSITFITKLQILSTQISNNLSSIIYFKNIQSNTIDSVELICMSTYSQLVLLHKNVYTHENSNFLGRK